MYWVQSTRPKFNRLNNPDLDPEVLLPPLEAPGDSPDHLLRVAPDAAGRGGRHEVRGKPCLHVGHPVVRLVLAELVGDALNGRGVAAEGGG